ncbi:hypothetical protein ACIGZJ_01135 [Kitasatospora sp. NPDC052868]|uniref:hypothetical protein n=1 Tax=Kitasatospora sp. NPDC052868 TaxID=3364060 RepID=UPI0037C4F3C5
MPDQHCPTCGTARSAGCRCLPDPSLTETAVLPHIEGPPLVRPYVPQAVDQVATDAPGSSVPVDPFATTVMPAAAQRPAARPPVTPPLGPDADAYATTVLPPMAPPQQSPQQTPGLIPRQPSGGYDRQPPGGYDQPYSRPHDQPHDPQPPAEDELGVFAFAAGPAEVAAPTGGRAARRAAEQAEQSPLARRRGLLVAAGAGLLVVTVGLAYAVAPSGEPDHSARPAPSTTLAPAPVDPPTPADPTPSAQPSATSEAPSPSPTRTTKPSPSRTATPPPAATTAPAAPPAPEPAPGTQPPAPGPAAPSTPAPTATTPAPTATPTPTPTPPPVVRVLERGMTGADVKDMQLRLSATSCGFVDKSIATSTFDWWTQTVLGDYQRSYKIKGETGPNGPYYGPKTRAALESDPGTC